MSQYIANLFILIRNVRAWLTAFGLFAILIWALWATNFQRIEYQEYRGELVQIIGANEIEDAPFYWGKVRLENGTEVKVALPPRQPYPRVGDQVPIIFERYDDGQSGYFFNVTAWVGEGGAS